MGTAMGVRGPILAQSPLVVGQPFAYPFVSNMISGLLFKGGFTLIDSFIFPSFIFSVGIVYSLFWLYKVLFKSRKIALIASMIFLLNGGMGFYYFAQDIAKSPTPVKTLLNPPHEYTRYDTKKIKWISVIDSMIIPQRAFTLGFPLALIALGLIYTASYQKLKARQKKIRIISAGIIIGMLPIVHSHSFLALFIILSCWSSSDLVRMARSKHLGKRVLHWLSLAGIVALLAIPLIFTFLSKNVGGDFLTWYPGWLAKEFNENWLLFWFKNWTIVPLLSLAAWGLLLQKKAANGYNFGVLFFPFFFIFVIANIWLFQPYPWDNTKLLIWSSLGFSGLTAWLFVQGWTHSNTLKPSKSYLLKTLITICFFFITASGAIDAYYISKHSLHSHVMFTREEVELANWARQNTPTDSRWLTGEQHNHWLFVLTGRQALMTYRGWLWTHGYEYRPVEAAVSKMFTHPEQSAHLFKEYAVNYVVIGPNEKRVWRADAQYFAEHFRLIKQTENYSIYQLDTI
jgi:hypothetical protein